MNVNIILNILTFSINEAAEQKEFSLPSFFKSISNKILLSTPINLYYIYIYIYIYLHN